MSKQEKKEQLLMSRNFIDELKELIQLYEKALIPEVVIGLLFYTGEYMSLRDGVSQEDMTDLLIGAKHAAAEAMEKQDDI